MAGIADIQPAQVQAQSVNAVDARPDVDISNIGKIPEFNDFINAYRQGVITAEDIKRRNIVGTTGYEAERASNVAAKTGAEQAQLDLSEIRPKQRELTEQQITGATTQQTLLNQMNDPDPTVALPAREAFQKRQSQIAAIQVFGTATPKLEVNAGVEPEKFDDWVTRQVNNFHGTDAQRATYETNLRLRGEKGDEFQTAMKAAKSRTRQLTPGTPEYDHELRERVDKALTHEQLQQIQFKTLEEFGKAQAQAVAKAPERALEIGTKESEIRKEIASLDPIKELDKARPQYQQILLDEQKVNSRTPEEWRKDPQAARALDIHLAFNFFKILHPDTRVTESNFKELKHLSPLDVGSEEVADQINNVLRGSYLDPTGRQRVIEEGKRAYQGYINGAKPIIQGYREHAARTGTDPDAITHPWKHVFEETPTTNPASPMPGAAPAQRTLPRPTPEQADAAPTYTAPSQVPNTVLFFKTPTGQLKVNPNYRQ